MLQALVFLLALPHAALQLHPFALLLAGQAALLPLGLRERLDALLRVLHLRIQLAHGLALVDVLRQVIAVARASVKCLLQPAQPSA